MRTKEESRDYMRRRRNIRRIKLGLPFRGRGRPKGSKDSDLTDRAHDGFKLRKSDDGDWVFVEGVGRRVTFISVRDMRNIDACAKRRGIKGYWYLYNPITIDGVTFA